MSKKSFIENLARDSAFGPIDVEQEVETNKEDPISRENNNGNTESLKEQSNTDLGDENKIGNGNNENSESKGAKEFVSRLSKHLSEESNPLSADVNLDSDSDDESDVENSATEEKESKSHPWLEHFLRRFVQENDSFSWSSVPDEMTPVADSKDEEESSKKEDLEEYIEAKGDDLISNRLSQEAYAAAGRILLSLGAQPFITAAMSVNTAKVAGETYPQAMKLMLGMEVGQFASNATATFKRRILTSVLPGSISASLGLDDISTVAVNTTAETAISGFITREAAERFGLYCMKKFPRLQQGGPSFDFAKVTHNDFIKKYGYSEKQWSDLKRMRNNYTANIHAQFGMLAARNAVFSAAIFMSRPWAKELVESHGDDIEQKTGLSKEKLETITTLSIRASLAAMTTIFDRAFTMSSIGNLSAQQVYDQIADEVKSGSVKKLFRGGISRTVVCLLTASTIAEGKAVGEKIKGVVDDVVSFFGGNVEPKKDDPNEYEDHDDIDIGEDEEQRVLESLKAFDELKTSLKKQASKEEPSKEEQGHEREDEPSPEVTVAKLSNVESLKRNEKDSNNDCPII